jgi:hypothetical protein
MKFTKVGVNMNTTAFEEGFKAYENYKHLSENPYPLNAGVCTKHCNWGNGFLEAQAIDNGDV